MSDIKPVLDCPQLVHGWLTAGGLSVVFGPSNCGKTFFTADLAMHVAAGKPWRGNRVQSGTVVYVAAEGGAGIFNRIEAMKQAKPEICEHDNFHLLPVPLDLSQDDDVTALGQLLPDAGIALVVVDTLARTMGDGDENSSSDMGRFVTNLDRVRDMTGAHVLVVHHSGKNTAAGARGSSSLRAAVDTEIAIDECRKATPTKQRDLRQSESLFFDLLQVEIGADQFGEPVTSAIVVDAEKPPIKTKPLSGRAEVAMQALNAAISEHGEIRTGPDFPSNRKSVATSAWKAECAKHGLFEGTQDGASRMAMKRAKDRLLDEDLIRIHGEFVWKVGLDE